MAIPFDEKLIAIVFVEFERFKSQVNYMCDRLLESKLSLHTAIINNEKDRESEAFRQIDEDLSWLEKKIDVLRDLSLANNITPMLYSRPEKYLYRKEWEQSMNNSGKEKDDDL